MRNKLPTHVPPARSTIARLARLLLAACLVLVGSLSLTALSTPLQTAWAQDGGGGSDGSSGGSDAGGADGGATGPTDGTVTDPDVCTAFCGGDHDSASTDTSADADTSSTTTGAFGRESMMSYAFDGAGYSYNVSYSFDRVDTTLATTVPRGAFDVTNTQFNDTLSSSQTTAGTDPFGESLGVADKLNGEYHPQDQGVQVAFVDGGLLEIVTATVIVTTGAAIVDQVNKHGPEMVDAGKEALGKVEDFVQNMFNEKQGTDKPADGNRVKDVPNRGEPGEVIEGERRTREYGEDGKPVRDYDRPHQGDETDHIHEWPGGVREHPGRPYSPWTRM